ncbi:MAG TPA: YfiR family protein [Allosphingosinicella sp.]|nr:YfiR family protein [Allosphingosinicella sp.]
MPGREAHTLSGTGRLIAIALLCAATAARAQPTDQAVKAAFLSKFARYVSWPPAARPGPGAPLQLCIIGQDNLGALIDRAAAGQAVEEHPITIKRIASPGQAASCQVAFVDGGSPKSTAAWLAALRGQPILTVTDAGAGATRGMIHFVVIDGRVRFYIDRAAASAARLMIDSRLLSLAVGARQARS